MDTKKLRQKILDLAIHGKLVPQDPNDEPASVLLERIRAEKEKLIKEGKIKAPKKSKSAGDMSHYPKEAPFEVPDGWVWCGFQEVAELISGQDFPSQKYNSTAKGIPYIIGASNIEDGHLQVNRWTENPSVLSRKGDVLVVCKGAGVGKVAVNDLGTVHIARQIQAIRIQNEIVSSDFMRILIDWCIPSIVSQANGLIPGLKRELLLNVLLPIPPRGEQDRIVSTFCSALAIVKGLEAEQAEMICTIKKMRERVLDLAIHGKLVPHDSSDEPAIELLKRINPNLIPSHNLHYMDHIPAGWVTARLGDIIDIISGTSYQKTDITTTSTGLKILRGGNIQNGHIVLCDDDVYISDKLINERANVQKGDIVVVASTGSSELIGKAAMSHQDYPRTQIGAFLRIVRPRSRDLSDYLGIIFQSELYKSHIRKVAKGTNINNIKAAYITEFIIPIPPFAEQRRIIKKVSSLFAILSHLIPE